MNTPNDHLAYLIVDHFGIDPNSLLENTTLASLEADEDDLEQLSEVICSEHDLNVGSLSLDYADTWATINAKMPP